MIQLRGLLAWLALGASLTFAEDFRIRNEVYSGNKQISETITLFRGGQVYDILRAPDEIVVFDPVRSRFVLLKPARSIRTEITLDQINRMVEDLKVELVNRGGGLQQFLASPSYEIKQENPKETRFEGDYASYVVKTEKAASLLAARQFSQFSDAYTRLNVMNNPALLARQPINTWLADQERVPTEVEVTYYKKTLGIRSKQQSYRSEHAITWFLSQDDLKRIEKIDRWLVTFEAVDFDTYRNASALEN